MGSSREFPGPAHVPTRPATRADVDFLRQMVYEALYVPAGSPPFPASVLDQPDIRHYYRGFGTRSGDAGRVATQESVTPVGAAWVRLFTAADHGYGFVDEDTPKLTIAVIPSRRGHGVGTTLLQDLLAQVPRCSLSVDRRNPARRLYERCGFLVVTTDGDTLTMLRDGLSGS